MKKQFYIVSIFIIVFQIIAFSQDADKSDTTKSIKLKNMIYGELGGSSIVLGLGYERVLYSSKYIYYTGSCGVSTALLINGINAGLGLNIGVKKCFIEIKNSLILTNWVLVLAPSFNSLHYSPSLGLRFFINKSNSISLGICYSPFIVIKTFPDDKIKKSYVDYGGLTIGYSF